MNYLFIDAEVEINLNKIMNEGDKFGATEKQ